MKRRFMKWLPPLPLLIPAVVSGVLMTLCFPPFSAWPLCFVALAPLFAAVLRARPSRKESFKTMFVCGVAFYVTLMWWVVKLLPSAGATIPWILTPAVFIMAFYLSLYPALAFVLLAAITRWRLVSFLIAAPAAWVMADLARSQGELSFPWGVMGYALSDAPVLVQSASAVGLFGLTFLIVVVNALLGAVFVLRDTRLRVVSLVGAVFVVVCMWGQGRSAIADIETQSGETVRTAIVQPNVDLKIKREAAALDAKLIIFPETCAPLYIEGRNKTFKHRLTALSRELDVSVYLGFLDHRYEGVDANLNIYNSSGLFAPDGRVSKYHKNHLLPFGEQLPLSWKFRWLRKISFGQANFMPGPAREPVEAAGTSFTPLICFESVFPYLCRRGVQQGAELLVNITNDGWFGDTPGPFQHAQMSILRAVEFRRYLVRSANSGVSMVVDPAGRVQMSLGLYEQGILAVEIAPQSGRTLYSRFGDWPVFLFSVLLLVAAGFVARRL
jgi:apolipoprotein N-acyltransferase